MAKKLKGKRPATKETRKILLGQIDKALPPLQCDGVSDTRIHETRTELKKARATLRLLRKDLPKAQYRAENQCLRDAARPLSQARDTAVLQQTFKSLLGATPHSSRDGCMARFSRDLTKDRTESRRALAGRNGLAHARRLLRNARSRAAHWRLDRKGWAIIGAGLKKVYGQGRDALDAARNSSSDVSFHEWRKQAKYLRYQVALLQDVKPREMDALAKALHQLTDYLGDDHDLAVLRAKLTANGVAEDKNCQLLCTKIQRQRAALREKALRLGGQIYKESAKRFQSRLHRYWRAWRR
jgi:CHAD domain-containing protein